MWYKLYSVVYDNILFILLYYMHMVLLAMQDDMMRWKEMNNELIIDMARKKLFNYLNAIECTWRF